MRWNAGHVARSLATGTALAAAHAGPALAQEATSSATAAAASGSAGPTPSPPDWIATLSSGVIARDGDAARPFVVAGLSRKLGRGYVRVAATGFTSVLKQVDAALPSSFALASIGAGGTFGNWFVDGSASAGRQFYGGVTTPLGTRSAQVVTGSSVYGGSLDGGRFVRLGHRLYLTPSVALQYSSQRALRSSLGAAGPVDYETLETAWTGSATLRLDRFFGPASRHLAGISVSRVQTTNGSVGLTGATGSAALVGVADGWTVAGASSSVRVARRLWLDGSATRTLGAKSGDYATLSLGVRLGF